MTEIEVPGPEPDWQPAAQPPYYTGKNPAYQYSVWEHSAPLFQMIGGLALPVQPVAQRLRLHVERSWDGLDDLDVVLFRLKGCARPLPGGRAHSHIAALRVVPRSVLGVLLPLPELAGVLMRTRCRVPGKEDRAFGQGRNTRQRPGPFGRDRATRVNAR
ncbi:hypothetical protein GCM10010252_27690 [Streptomyces aureoverticillatus]|nr:hypothetical protein GCM10010252_27690 [Streptomyces aureoverticillatus]